MAIIFPQVYHKWLSYFSIYIMTSSYYIKFYNFSIKLFTQFSNVIDLKVVVYEELVAT